MDSFNVVSGVCLLYAGVALLAALFVKKLDKATAEEGTLSGPLKIRLTAKGIRSLLILAAVLISLLVLWAQYLRSANFKLASSLEETKRSLQMAETKAGSLSSTLADLREQLRSEREKNSRPRIEEPKKQVVDSRPRIEEPKKQVVDSRPPKTPNPTVGNHEAQQTASVQSMRPVTVVGIDRATRTVTLETDEGKQLSLVAAKSLDLDKIEIGDRLNATYTESVAIAIEPAPSRGKPKKPK